MKFDWLGFKYGEIVVHCATDKDAEDFLNECREHGIMVTEKVKVGSEWGYRLSFGTVVFNGLDYYKEHKYKIIDWKKQEQPKTIADALQNIKDGEIYQSVGDRFIKCKDGKITIETDSHSVTFLQNEYFRKMKEVDFATAIEYMKQGGRATCLVNERAYKIADGQLKSAMTGIETQLTLKQIESKWLIEE